MGLIKAGIGALGGTLADQWKEFFYCDALPNDVLMRKGEKRVSGRSSDTKETDTIISNGYKIGTGDPIMFKAVNKCIRRNSARRAATRLITATLPTERLGRI